MASVVKNRKLGQDQNHVFRDDMFETAKQATEHCA